MLIEQQGHKAVTSFNSVSEEEKFQGYWNAVWLAIPKRD